MGSADVFHVICIEFRFHRNAFPPKDLMILRTGQRSQAEKLDNVERELPLYDRDITSDPVGGIRREAQDVARKRDDALRLPGKQHLAIFGDLVLALLRRDEIVRVDVLQSNEHPRDAGPLRFAMKFSILWQRVSTWIIRPSGIPPFSRSSIRRSKIASHSWLRAKLSSVMKNLWIPCAQLRRTRSSTSSAQRWRDLRPCTLMIVQDWA